MTATTREILAAAAATNGWAKDERQSGLLQDFYRKGRRYVRIHFTIGGAIVDGAIQRSRSGGYLNGKGKREQVLAEFAK